MEKPNFLSNDDFLALKSCSIIAVTGPMAAGKNFICNQLSDLNFISIDADVVAHEAINLCTDKIFNTFNDIADKKGINLKNHDGTLNRRALGALIFNDDNLLAKQEAILYPKITELIENFIKSNSDKKIIINATVLYKIPKLVEKCQLILFVTAPFFTRLFRARKRDNMPFKQILGRFKAQRELFQKYRNFGKKIIIINNKNQ